MVPKVHLYTVKFGKLPPNVGFHHMGAIFYRRSGVTIEVPNYLAGVLHDLIMSPNAAYDDEKMFFLYLDNAYKDFASYCKRKGVSEAEIFAVEERGETIDNNARFTAFVFCF